MHKRPCPPGGLPERYREQVGRRGQFNCPIVGRVVSGQCVVRVGIGVLGMKCPEDTDRASQISKESYIVQLIRYVTSVWR